MKIKPTNSPVCTGLILIAGIGLLCGIWYAYFTLNRPQYRSVTELSRIVAGKPSDFVLSVLSKALDDPQFTVRMAAADGLAQLGHRAEAVLPALQKLTTDEKYGVRMAAARAIQAIQSVGGATQKAR